jgi:hypothetical protein
MEPNPELEPEAAFGFGRHVAPSCFRRYQKLMWAPTQADLPWEILRLGDALHPDRHCACCVQDRESRR